MHLPTMLGILTAVLDGNMPVIFAADSRNEDPSRADVQTNST